MATGIDADPDTLAQSARGIGQAAQDFADGLTGLQSTITSESPWGGDEPGTAFGMVYVAVLGHAIESMSSHLDTLVQASQGLGQWAQLLSGTESGVSRYLTSIHDGMAG